MTDTLLVVNSGSSSVKLALFDRAKDQITASALAERLGGGEPSLTLKTPDRQHQALPEGANHQRAIQAALDGFSEAGLLAQTPAGIGHRVVHGGERFTGSVRIDADVIDSIDACTPLAPLHNPANLEGIRATQSLYPEVPQVAVFDTAFHQSLPRHAFLYALPYELYRDKGVRRYGFHGTSHRFMLQETARRLNQDPAHTSLISAHLGNGCSITAIRNGQSVDTSMGLTPLEGLVMGTRSGDIDPGLFDFLRQQGGYAPDAIHRMLNRDSGLQGLSGLSNDMRTLIDAADEGHEQAALAVEVFCFRLARYIGAMMVSAGKLDALVFTGGIGENSARVRAMTVAHLKDLGFHLSDANGTHGRDRDGAIHSSDSHRILVIPTDEEGVIARDTAALIN